MFIDSPTSYATLLRTQNIAIASRLAHLTSHKHDMPQTCCVCLYFYERNDAPQQGQVAPLASRYLARKNNARPEKKARVAHGHQL